MTNQGSARGSRGAPTVCRAARVSWLTCVTTAVAIAACSDTAAPDTTSTFQGTLALETFPTRPDALRATNELGDVTLSSTGSHGEFRLELSRDHTYQLMVASGTNLVGVVFPRASGQLGSRFAVASGAAVVSLGSVRYLASAPAAGFFVKSARLLSSTPTTPQEQDGEIGECVDGIILGTGAVCVDDDGDLACEGEASDGDGECENGVDATTGLACVDPPEESDGDGECENGIDVTTGLACVDPPEESDGDGECENGIDVTTGQSCVDSDVDPSGPLAIAEHNVPDQVGGCDEGGEEEDDDD